MKKIYISATLKDCGKTSVTLGLLQALRERGYDPGYTKPVGQRYVNFKNENLDEDAVLIYETFGLGKLHPKDLSPVAVGRGFTRKFIFESNVAPLEEKISKAVANIEKEHEIILIEGTGHAGVGSCFGLSNARVAELLDSEVIIVVSGGIGKPLDEAALSLSLFRQHGVKIKGVIQNKVIPEKYDKVTEAVSKGLENMGTRLLGAIPFEPMLTRYTISQIADMFEYEVYSGMDSLHNKIEHIVVAAMEPQNVLQYVKAGSLIITPGDRIDNILLAVSLSGTKAYHQQFCTSGLILTGGFMPEDTILSLLRASGIPVLVTREETYTVSARMKDLLFKIQTSDSDKIKATQRLVEKYVDIDAILA
ncbi:MAG: phosphotransacetylase family protein [Sedimentisphaeraceae bacterium JB056]